MVAEMDDPKLGKLKCLVSPWKLYGVPPVTPKPYIEENILL